MSYLSRMCGEMQRQAAIVENVAAASQSAVAAAAAAGGPTASSPLAAHVERQLHLTFHQILVQRVWLASTHASVPYVPDYTAPLEAQLVADVLVANGADVESPAALKEFGNSFWRRRSDIAACGSTAEVEMCAFVAHLAFTKAIALLDAAHRAPTAASGRVLSAVPEADRALLSQAYSNRSMAQMALIGSAVMEDAAADVALLDAVRATIYAAPCAGGGWPPFKPFYRGLVAAAACGLADIAALFAHKGLEIPAARDDPTFAELARRTLGLPSSSIGNEGPPPAAAASATALAKPTACATTAAAPVTAARLQRMRADLIEAMRALRLNPTAPELRRKMFASVKGFERAGFMVQRTGDAATDVELVGALALMMRLFPPTTNSGSPGSQLPGWFFNVTTRSRIIGLKPEASGGDQPLAAGLLNSMWLDAALAVSRHCSTEKATAGAFATETLTRIAMRALPRETEDEGPGQERPFLSATQMFLAAHVLIASAQNERIEPQDSCALEKLLSRRRVHEAAAASFAPAMAECGADERAGQLLALLHDTNEQLRCELDHALSAAGQR